MQLPDYLQLNPWPERMRASGQPLDYIQSWHLRSDRLALWPALIDTSGFNQRLGLPPIKYTEQDGRLFGNTKTAGFELEWEEEPWQWDYLHAIGNIRHYRRGFAHYVRVQYLLQEQASGTQIFVYFGWIPRHRRGWLLLKASMPLLYKKFGQTLAALDAEISQRVSFRMPAFTLDAQASRILEDRLAPLQESWPQMTDQLRQMIRSKPDEQMDRLRVFRLADAWGLERMAVLRFFLEATKAAICKLSWDVICPHCRGVRTAVEHLYDLPQQDHCEACQLDFSATGLNTIEITFHVHPAIRQIEPVLYCAAEPAKKPHIYLQRLLRPGQTYSFNLAVPPGRYRLRVTGDQYFDLLDIKSEHAHRSLTLDTPSGYHHHLAVGASLTLRNSGPPEKQWILERHDFDYDLVRPADLFTLQEFRDLFSSEAIAVGLKLDVGDQTLLFTDIVGSTRLYQVNGDASAFSRVHEHFQTCYQIVKEHRGAIVKTMGDAIMAAFADPANAARTALTLQKKFSQHPDTAIRLRITIHSGPCLAVRLNSNVDYFGNSVNVGAKLQNICEANQIVISQPVVQATNFPAQDFAAYQAEQILFPIPKTETAMNVVRYTIT
ncbi:MAG: adenylate/guanylate cyclase domain-containing protein [Leptospiraceae bacterium]|nr:adenylate/guanylate cyclase domain-containing protein [Leptospiraceae bacterium]